MRVSKSFFTVCFVFMASTQITFAADNVHLLSIDDALKKNSDLLNPNIELFFSSKLKEKIIQDRGFFVSNKKTNGFLKPVKSSCTRAFLSAIISLQQRAVNEGGNAVINIHSFYRKKEMFSEELFECHKGNTIAGVALKGRVVRLAN